MEKTDIKKCNDILLSLHLLNIKDDKKYIKTLYSIANRVERNYTIYKIKKKTKGYRTIYAPNDILKHIQKNILKNILESMPISVYATAYHKGLSLKDNASPHINKDIILKLDISDFFESISFMDVYNTCFSLTKYPKSVGMILTYLCTYDEHLTQGSPTSAYISNLVMKNFDEIIGNYCKENNISYTRYSDDMTFSGDFNPSEVIKYVRKELYNLGLQLNNDKIHIVKKYRRQNITGIVVNEKVQVSSNYRKKIRQEMYYIKKYGITSHLDKKKTNINEKKYLNSLLGMVNYVLQIDNNKEFIEYHNHLTKLIKE